MSQIADAVAQLTVDEDNSEPYGGAKYQTKTDKIFIVSGHRQLRRLSPHLVAAPPAFSTIAEVSETNVLNFSKTPEDAAGAFERCDLTTPPVVDARNRVI